MKVLVKALEWVRPLVETKAWDYCIVWEFGDDPSRYIEWIGCCCSGSYGDCKNVKEEIDATNQHFPAMCKDTYVKHCARTKACEKLAKCPSSFPLYSGIHGEVAMTNQPSWLVNELAETQVLIPVLGGLIEFFSANQVPKDQMMIETLMAQFNISLEQKHSLVECPERQLKCRLLSLPCHGITPTLQLLPPVPQPITHANVQGSPTGSNPLSEHSSLVSGSTHVSPTRPIGKSENGLGYGNSVVVKENPKARQRTGKEPYQSKNLVTERNRRNRIKDGLFALRALVPNISKMDRLAIVGDAIEYIKELQTSVKDLQEELQKLDDEEEDYKSNEVEYNVCKQKRTCEATMRLPTRAHRGASSTADNQTEVELEVHAIAAKGYLLKFVYSKEQGRFSRIMETLNSLGLEVLDVNVTTCNGRVLNILKVEAKGKEVAAKRLKDSLLSCWSSHRVNGSSRRS